MVIRNVLDHVLAEDVVECCIFKREAARRVEIQHVREQRESVHIQPTRKHVFAASDVQFFNFRLSQIPPDDGTISAGQPMA